MPSTRRRGVQPSTVSAETLLGAAALVLLTLVVGGAWCAIHLADLLASNPQHPPLNPATLAVALATGETVWTDGTTVVVVAEVLFLLGTVGLVVWWRRRRKRRSSRVDRAAVYMGSGDELAALTEQGAAATARRLGVTGAPGVPIGRVVADGRMLYGSWEDMHIDIWGPRTGKTTSRAIPAILAAPATSSVLVTSNKRDATDATRDVRAEITGNTPWVFDPQQIAREEPTWWWNPLSYVTDEVKAAQLAGHFASGSRENGARADAYFDGEGRNLLAGLLLAAALDDRPITDVYTWLTRPTDDTAVAILADHGFPLQADGVAGIVNAPDKQRAGVFGTAAQMASCLTNRRIAPWITRQGADDDRPHFDPYAFARGGHTLYSLSKEGAGTAGPLVTALTVAVVEAAEEIGSASPGGRLPTPLLGVLDEVANVCKWAELPNQYSHYGSRGIVLMAILQSWSQGVEVWGQEGMRKLWSAANVKVYGGGVSETAFLQELSQLIGDYDRRSVSASISRDGRSTTRQLTNQTTMDVADLGALPRGRAVLIASGAPPTLIRTVPWMAGPHAQAVKASIAAHEAGGQS
ncbi:Type IV secretory pathway, VirD4 component, TraG/TraD family ATPase [Marinactinospora thermotolerans DSM 45154]|uniref:Type IV secretory pathway, VirD4 component, TraG/TraD family ATPase n=1 Tax=Marinactinospora thermotolerans DSM 45154 TaxID=1122192 RepID=A0A1T4M3L4_9ACTN|nr:type IV secretory system conjugative DNA transfer family protein [Marinactinospora thermotolerans]SJZ61580.1 Type IV secretory pathway, VirD4 component, TraG/TraD family ATPase [Marinactinospora thermotolerans DSM 45154]